MSVRRACKIFKLSRTAFYYVGYSVEDGAIQNRLLDLALQYPTYGYWKLYYLLRDEGHIVNHKRVYRLYKTYVTGQRCQYLATKELENEA